jgi:hypothetical protein
VTEDDTDDAVRVTMATAIALARRAGGAALSVPPEMVVAMTDLTSAIVGYWDAAARAFDEAAR